MSRISSYASNQQLVGRLLLTQERLLDLQYQVNSEKKSPTYSGIARDSQRLINIENSRDRLQNYISNNEREQTRLNIADTSVEAFRVSVNNFKKELNGYTSGTPTTRENIDSVQAAAFRACGILRICSTPKSTAGFCSQAGERRHNRWISA